MTGGFSVTGGRLRRGGVPFTAVGVNYHPSAAGCRIWTEWDLPRLAADFAAMGRAGLNTVRLFLFWRDAQPCADRVDAEVLDRLAAAVRAAGGAGLSCVVSLFTIWMNGQLLDLPWRYGADIWRDPAMLRAEETLARTVARTLRGQDNVLAYDLGDELWNIAPDLARTLSRTDVAAWQGRIAAAIRAEAPGALVLQANDASGVFGAGPYGSDNCAGLDLVGTHGFPSWAAGSIESTLSYKATNLVPFLVRASAAYGTPLVDELGAYGVGEQTVARYLRAAAAAALGNGATGVLAWCWQDIASSDEPYLDRPMERLTGLHRLDGTAKPAMTAFRRVVASCPTPPPGRPAEPVALYLPDRLRGGGGSYLDGAGSSVAAYYAYLLLKRAHLGFDVIGGDGAGLLHRPPRLLVLCASADHLTLRDLDRLRRSAEQGATVYLSMGDHLHGFPGGDLCGVEIVDARPAAGMEALEWDGRSWPLDWTRSRPTLLDLAGAVPLGHYPDGSPALVAHRVGRGTVLFTNAPIEAQLDRPGRLVETEWHAFYRRIAARAGVAPPLTCSAPDIEILTGLGADGDQTLLINHSERPVRAELAVADGAWGRRTVRIDGKDWTVLPAAGRVDREERRA